MAKYALSLVPEISANSKKCLFYHFFEKSGFYFQNDINKRAIREVSGLYN